MSSVRVRLFGPAREAARTASDEFQATDVGEVLAAASARYGAGFAGVLARCRVWVNGEESDNQRRLGDGDEVAVLPPVSGG